MFDKISRQLKIEKADQDLKNYEAELTAVSVNKDFYQQIVILLNIGNIFLNDKNNYSLAANCYNAALAIYDNHGSDTSSKFNNENEIRNSILTKMAEVEIKFNVDIGGKNQNCSDLVSVIQKRREILKLLRKNAQDEMDSGIPGFDIVKQLTTGFKNLFSTIVQESINELGTPPCGYAFVGFGSMGREEMCPLSDIDCGIIIQDVGDAQLNKHNKEYFRKLTRSIQLKIINCGETVFPIFRLDKQFLTRIRISNLKHFKHIFAKEESPTPSGFSFDPAGLQPLGYKNEFELIVTVDELIDLNKKESFIEEHEHLVTALKTVCFVTGTNSNLIDQYESKLKLYLDSIHTKSQKPQRQYQAMRLLELALRKFKPPLNQEKENERFFHIKRDLQRLPHMVIECLATLCGLTEKTTMQRISALVSKNILKSEAAQHLLNILNIILHFRIKTQLFYKDEIEYVHHNFLEAKHPLSLEEQQKVLILTEDEVNNLLEIYRVLLPLYKACKIFLEISDLAIFKNCKLWDDSFLTQGETMQRFCHYKVAEKHFQKVLAITPDDPEALTGHALSNFNLAQYQIAIEQYLRAITILRSDKKNNKESLAMTLSNLCFVYMHSDNIGEASQLLKEAYLLFKEIYNTDENTNIVIILKHIAVLHQKEGRIERAVECLHRALKSSLALNEDILSAAIVIDLANLHRQQGQADKSVTYLRESLEIFNQRYDNSIHPNIAAIHENLGLAYKDLGETTKAATCLEDAVITYHVLFGDKHPQMANVLLNRGLVYQQMGNLDKAINDFKAAGAIYLEKYKTEEHRDLVETLNYLSYAYYLQGDLASASQNIQDSLRICRKIFRTPDLLLSESLHYFGMILVRQKNKLAIEIFKEAIKIVESLLKSESTLKVAEISNDLANAYYEFDEIPQALFHFKQSLIKYKQVFQDKPHYKLAQLLSNLACMVQDQDSAEALQYYTEALNILKLLPQERPIIITKATALFNMGCLSKKKSHLANAKQILTEAKKEFAQVLDINHDLDYALCLYHLGVVHILLESYKSGIDLLMESREIYLQDKKNINETVYPLIKISNKLGYSFLKSNNKMEAVNYYNQAFVLLNAIYEKSEPRTKKMLSKLLSLIKTLGNLHFETNNKEMAIRFYKEVYRCCRSLNDEIGMQDAANILEKIKSGDKFNKNHDDAKNRWFTWHSGLRIAGIASTIGIFAYAVYQISKSSHKPSLSLQLKR